MRLALTALCLTLLLTACDEQNLNTPQGQKTFTPQPVLSPPGSDINAIGGFYSVPPRAHSPQPPQPE